MGHGESDSVFRSEQKNVTSGVALFYSCFKFLFQVLVAEIEVTVLRHANLARSAHQQFTVINQCHR